MAVHIALAVFCGLMAVLCLALLQYQKTAGWRLLWSFNVVVNTVMSAVNAAKVIGGS